MKDSFRRSLSLFLAIVMCFSLFPVTAFASDGEEVTDASGIESNDSTLSLNVDAAARTFTLAVTDGTGSVLPSKNYLYLRRRQGRQGRQGEGRQHYPDRSEECLRRLHRHRQAHGQVPQRRGADSQRLRPGLCAQTGKRHAHAEFLRYARRIRGAHAQLRERDQRRYDLREGRQDRLGASAELTVENPDWTAPQNPNDEPRTGCVRVRCGSGAFCAVSAKKPEIIEFKPPLFHGRHKKLQRIGTSVIFRIADGARGTLAIIWEPLLRLCRFCTTL